MNADSRWSVIAPQAPAAIESDDAIGRGRLDLPAGTEKTDTITAFSLGWSFGK